MIQSRVVATTVLILIALTIPAIAQDDLTDAQYEELSRALNMPVEEIRAMNLPPDDLQVRLDRGRRLELARTEEPVNQSRRSVKLRGIGTGHGQTRQRHPRRRGERATRHRRQDGRSEPPQSRSVSPRQHGIPSRHHRTHPHRPADPAG